MKKTTSFVLLLTLLLFCKKPETPAPTPAETQPKPQQEAAVSDFNMETDFVEVVDTLQVVIDTPLRSEPSDTATISCCPKAADDTTVDSKCPVGLTSIQKAGTQFHSHGKTMKKIRGQNGEFYWYIMHFEVGANCQGGTPWIRGDAVRAP
ncbi:MAG: hypothetical protein ACOY5B_06620 [Spirochaetota bacterium]